MFQSPRLLNWLTVEDNIRFVLEAQNVPRPRWRELVAKNLDMVGLAGQERNYPLNLSGGMQQRVAIARALAIEPDILLMDEPFSHLDAITARKIRFDLMEILARAKPTILFVTHDLAEAVFLSDNIYMMSTKPARIFKRVTIDVPRPRSRKTRRCSIWKRRWCANSSASWRPTSRWRPASRTSGCAQARSSSCCRCGGRLDADERSEVLPGPLASPRPSSRT